MPITPITISTVGESGTVTLSASGLPTGLTFTDNGDGTGVIEGTLDDGTASGSPYPVTVTATDTSGQEDTETVTIVVLPAPLQPLYAGLVDNANPFPASSGNSFDENASEHLYVRQAGYDLFVLSEYFGGSTTNSYLKIIDASNPDTPVLLPTDFAGASYTDRGPTNADDYRVVADPANDRIYVAGDRAVGIFDISDPSNPVAGAFEANFDGLTNGDIDFNGTYLLTYLTVGAAAIDIRDGNTLAVLGQITGFGQVDGMLAKTDNVFVRNAATAVIYQYRLDGSGNPSLWATYDAGPGTGAAYRGEMAMLPGGTHFVALQAVTNVSDGNLVVFEVGVAENATAVSPIATIPLPNVAIDSPSRAMRIDSDTNGNVYIAGDDRLVVVDCSTPAAPSIASTVMAGESLSGVAVSNGKVAVYSTTSGLAIFT